VDAAGMMSMSTSRELAPERTRLNFPHLVEQGFAFLSKSGFAQVEELPTIVRYRKDDIELDVYHGRKSFEIAVEIHRSGWRFSMSEIIRASDPGAAESYRNPTALTIGEVKSGIEKVARALQRYGEQALRGDVEFFAELKRQRQAWADAYSLDVLAEQIRPRADAAFREGRYREAAELYERISARLSPAEQKKLAAAQKRA
jgi:hypothetical protein